MPQRHHHHVIGNRIFVQVEVMFKCSKLTELFYHMQFEDGFGDLKTFNFTFIMIPSLHRCSRIVPFPSGPKNTKTTQCITHSPYINPFQWWYTNWRLDDDDAPSSSFVSYILYIRTGHRKRNRTVYAFIIIVMQAGFYAWWCFVCVSVPFQWNCNNAVHSQYSDYHKSWDISQIGLSEMLNAFSFLLNKMHVMM